MIRRHYIVRADGHKGNLTSYDDADEATRAAEKHIAQGYRQVVIYRSVAVVTPKPVADIAWYDD